MNATIASPVTLGLFESLEAAGYNAGHVWYGMCLYHSDPDFWGRVLSGLEVSDGLAQMFKWTAEHTERVRASIAKVGDDPH